MVDVTKLEGIQTHAIHQVLLNEIRVKEKQELIGIQTYFNHMRMLLTNIRPTGN